MLHQGLLDCHVAQDVEVDYASPAFLRAVVSWENWLVTSSRRVIASGGEVMIKLSQISNLKVFELKFLIQ